MRGIDQNPEEPMAVPGSGLGALAGPPVTGPLLAWLLAALQPMPRARVKQLLHHGKITINGVATTRFDYPLRPGDCVTVAGKKSGPNALSKAGISILFADDDLLVVDKPAGILTVASEGERSRTVFAILLAHMAERQMGRPFVVRSSTAKPPAYFSARSSTVPGLVASRLATRGRTYLGIVEGLPARPATGTVRSYLTEGKDLRMRTISAGAVLRSWPLRTTRFSGPKVPMRWSS